MQLCKRLKQMAVALACSAIQQAESSRFLDAAVPVQAAGRACDRRDCGLSHFSGGGPALGPRLGCGGTVCHEPTHTQQVRAGRHSSSVCMCVQVCECVCVCTAGHAEPKPLTSALRVQNGGLGWRWTCDVGAALGQGGLVCVAVHAASLSSRVGELLVIATLTVTSLLFPALPGSTLPHLKRRWRAAHCSWWALTMPCSTAHRSEWAATTSDSSQTGSTGWRWVHGPFVRCSNSLQACRAAGSKHVHGSGGSMALLAAG
jgi:hypothetical protein